MLFCELHVCQVKAVARKTGELRREIRADPIQWAQVLSALF